MATTTDQQAALQDAMTRAKEIAAKLQADQPPVSPQQTNGTEGEETRKRALIDRAPEPAPKRNLLDGVQHDPHIVAQKVASLLQQKSGLGSMLVEEIQIPNKLVGLVIGRGGEMINRLQTESGAKVQVAPDPSPDEQDGQRKVTITGTSDAVNNAKRIIDDIRVNGKIPERLLAGAAPGEFSVEITIPRGKVGLVIGKGGENIKNLQEQADCKMVLFQDGEFANSMDKPLRITGEHGAVMFGKQLVQDLLISKEMEGMGDGAAYREVEVPREAVGLIIGARGANIHQIQIDTGCRIRFKNDMEGPTKTAMLSGNPQQLAIAESKLRDIISGNVSTQKPQMNGGMMPQWPGGMMPQWGGGMMPSWGAPSAPGWGGPSKPHLPPGHKDITIQVPANRCGLVIGKGGETIKFIKKDTGISIELNNNQMDPHFRIFRAQGTDEMIEKTLEIIREKTNERTIEAKPVVDSNTNQSPWPVQPMVNQQWTPESYWSAQQQAWGQAGQPVASTWGQPQTQPVWNPQTNQWQQPVMGQWPGQPYQAQPTQSSATVSTTITQPAAQGATTGQPDYSAAWALYYQQQQQYYQQYAMQQQQQLQQQQSAAAAAAVSSSTGAAPTAATAVSAASNPQAQAMAEYQAKLMAYYKHYGVTAPQAQQAPQ